MEVVIGLAVIINLTLFIFNYQSWRRRRGFWTDEGGERIYRIRDLKLATVYHSPSHEDDNLLLDLYKRQLTLMPHPEVINRACALHLELLILRRRLRAFEEGLHAAFISAEATDHAGG